MDYSRYDVSLQETIKNCESLSVSGDPSAIEKLDELRDKAVAMGDNGLIGHTHYYAANWYFDASDSDNYRRHLKDAVYYLLRSDDRELLARSYNLFALEAHNNEALDMAYHYYHMANRLVEETDNIGVSAAMLGNLAVVFYETKDFDSAREYCRRAIELIDLNEESPYYIHNKLGGYINDGLISIALEDISEARKAHRIAADLRDHMDQGQFKEIHISFLVFELSLYLAEGDERGFDECMRELFERISCESSQKAVAFLLDIKELCLTLLERDREENVEELIMAIEDKVKESGFMQAMRLLYEIKIAYYDAIQNERNLDVCLREHHKLMQFQSESRLKMYNHSAELMSLVLDLQEEELKRA